MRYPIEILTAEEIDRLIGACSRRAPTGRRNAALIALLHSSAIRISEALSLMPRDIDLDTGTVNVRDGKGSRQRIVGMNSQALALLERWYDSRRKLGLNGRHPIFSTVDGRTVDSSYVRHLLPRLARRAGIEKRVHAHGLRHSRAVDLERQGERVSVIQRVLGHSSLQTTAVYLGHVSPSDAIAATQRETST
jgi:integrase/recombinase XerD